MRKRSCRQRTSVSEIDAARYEKTPLPLPERIYSKGGKAEGDSSALSAVFMCCRFSSASSVHGAAVNVQGEAVRDDAVQIAIKGSYV